MEWCTWMQSGQRYEHNMINDYIERITEGDKIFESEYAFHIARYKLARDIFLEKKYIKKILDIGCGTGYGTAYFSDYFSCNIIGIDNSNKAINYAKNQYNVNHLIFQTMDALNLKIPSKSVDAVISFEVIEHVNNPQKFIKEIKRVMKKNSICILSTPNKNLTSKGLKKPHNPYHIQEFYKEDLEKLLKTHFSKVTILGEHVSKSYDERLKVMSLIQEIMTNKNETYVNFLRGLIPRFMLKIIPSLLRKRIGQKIYERGEQKNKKLNELSRQLYTSLSISDIEIDRFHINTSPVLVAICKV